MSTSPGADSVQQQLLDSPPLHHLSSMMPVREVELRALSTEIDVYVRTPSCCDAVEKVLRGLFNRQTPGAFVVGARGCGKTALLMFLAHEVLSGSCRFESDLRVLYIDTANVGAEDSRAVLESLVAGITSFTNVLILLDNMATLFSRPGGGTNRPLLRTLMARPGVRLVGTMQEAEYKDLVSIDAIMARRSSRVGIAAPDAGELQEIALHRARFIEREEGVSFSADLVHRTQVMTSTFLLGEAEPARTIDVLRSIVDRKRFEIERGRICENVATELDVATHISERSGVGTDTILGQNKDRNFIAALSSAVVGQSQAVSDVATELELIAAGLNEQGKPASVLMFAGMTGVGKTELARQIAKLYSPTGRLNVYCMGNYTEPHSVSSIIGVPPGYVGHEDGGRIVSDLLADPYSVFLLDEAEKCHPNVWKPFLNLFDEGWIQDQRGRRAYADHAMFILTTNAGDRGIVQLRRSGKSSEEIADHIRKTLSRVRQERSSQPVFPPQFLSRIRRIAIFEALSLGAMCSIAQMSLERVADKWMRLRAKRLRFSGEVAAWIGEEGWRRNEASNGEEGGRIIQKLVSDRIELSLVRGAVEHPDIYHRCQEITVSVSDMCEDVCSVKMDS